MYVDAHCHLADVRFTPHLDTVIARSRKAGVTSWIQGGVCPDDWSRQRALRSRWGAEVVPSFGLHPWWVAEAEPPELEAAQARLEREIHEVAALGELGLDFTRGEIPRQREAFDRQLALAVRTKKPLILHVVRAHSEALETLRRHAPGHSGLVHAFSGSLEAARGYLDLGLLISVGAGAVREGFHAMKKALKYLPPDRLVLETDSPDGPFRSEPNEPRDLLAVGERVASLVGETGPELLARSARNLRFLIG